ncbi:MAG: exosortase-associated EpsI family protein [Isosphaeraceae bacterium]|nr:exosortase-associated EpsI family protein [Isosphaeraceae bacterium]
MVRILPVVAALLVVILSGVGHGLWTDRWQRSDGLAVAVAQLEQVAMTLGDWEGRANHLDQEVLEKAGFAGYVSRRYVNRRDGRVVSILLACGRPGPLSVHTPELCYPGAGYQPVTLPTRFHLPSPPRPAEFLVAGFRNAESFAAPQLRIFWSWGTAGIWRAPDNPRWAFAASPVLYKLYVIHETADANGRPEDDATSLAFLRRLLPELERVLFADR